MTKICIQQLRRQIYGIDTTPCYKLTGDKPCPDPDCVVSSLLGEASMFDLLHNICRNSYSYPGWIERVQRYQREKES